MSYFMPRATDEPSGPVQSPTSVWDDYRRAEIGLEYLEEIKIGHKSYRTSIEEAARDAVLNFLRG